MRNYMQMAATSIVVVLLSLMTTNTSLVYADSQENHKQHQMEGMPNHEMPSSSNKVISQEPQMAHSVIGANPSVDREEHGSHKDDSHKSKTDEGPDWPVLYGFGGFNLAVIAAAGFFKYTRSNRKEVG